MELAQLVWYLRKDSQPAGLQRQTAITNNESGILFVDLLEGP